MIQTATTRDIQRNYRKVFDLAKKTKKPVYVMRNSKPDIVIIDVKKLEELEEMEAINAVLRSREEARAGRTKRLKSLTHLFASTHFSNVASLKGVAGRLNRPLSWRKIKAIAHEDRSMSKYSIK